MRVTRDRCLLAVLLPVVLLSVGCDGRPDMSGSYIFPVGGSLQVGSEARQLSGTWSVAVSKSTGHRYEVTVQGCTLETEEQQNGVAVFVANQECALTPRANERLELDEISGQISHRTDLGINLTLTGSGHSNGEDIELRIVFPAGP